MKNEQLENIAQNLYVHGGLSQAEIARQVGKSPTQINRWAKNNNWHQLRAANTITPDTIIANTYAQIQSIYDIATDEDRPVNSKETDQIAKLMAGVRQLKKEADLSLYSQIMGEFIIYIRKSDEGLMEAIAPYQMEFLTKKAAELTNG